MSYYQDLARDDVIEWCEPLLKGGHFTCRPSDGKLVENVNQLWDTPWHHHAGIKDAECPYLLFVLFQHVSPRCPIGQFVPERCQYCWKVVVRPKTLDGLFTLEELQYQMRVPSKCGIERRPIVNGLYGGYFYNNSLEEGRAKYKQVREIVDSYPTLGPETPVILKRSCTEMEFSCGRSDKWEVTDEQRRIEKVCDIWILRDYADGKQADHIVNHVRREWIRWAYANGDETYKNYTDGKSLFPQVVTYHQEEKSAADKKGKKGKKSNGKDLRKEKG